MTASGSLKPLVVEMLTETDARSICSWHYPYPYDVYDYADWETVVKEGWDLSIPEKRSAEYVGFKYNNGLVAFGRFSVVPNLILIGIGLRPDYCGQGFGAEVMNALIAIAKKRYPQNVLALEVRTFNTRAIRCYESCGFRKTRRYVRNTLTGEDIFYLMVYRE